MDSNIRTSLFSRLGIDALPEAKQDEILLGAGKLIFQGVMMKLLPRLSEEDKDTLEKLMLEQGGDQEQVLAFLKERVPDLDAVVQEEVEMFLKESGALLERMGK